MKSLKLTRKGSNLKIETKMAQNLKIVKNDSKSENWHKNGSRTKEMTQKIPQNVKIETIMARNLKS